jgi:hypothetical protein
MLQILNLYKGISHVQAKSGESVLFWKDVWKGRLLHVAYPQDISSVCHYQEKLIQNSVNSIY